MDKVIFSYLRTHTLMILTLLATAFVILAAGEIVLYRNVMDLNRMLSEGLIQIKEDRQLVPSQGGTQGIMIKPVKLSK